VRQIREDAAAAEYTAREQALLAAKKETAARQQALEEYIVWRKEEEERRYAAILNRQMDLNDLDTFKAGLAALRDKDNILLEAVALARKAEEEAGTARETAFAALKQARKDKEKLSTHREIWQVEENREVQRLEDLEMEEFSGKKAEGE
jgi:type III secretion protein O